MEKYIRLFAFLLLTTLITAEAVSQRSRTRSRSREEVKETPSFTENLNYEIKIGNIGIGSSFNLSMKPGVGYKFHKNLSAGIGSRFNYAFINIPGGSDISEFDFGFFGYGRFKIGNSFYIQGEYTTYSFDFEPRINMTYPLFGAGYVSGSGPWNFGVELMFIADELARDRFGSVGEWWFSFSYNF